MRAVLLLASAVESLNCGMTAAARIARITTTINSSISVNAERRRRSISAALLLESCLAIAWQSLRGANRGGVMLLQSTTLPRAGGQIPLRRYRLRPWGGEGRISGTLCAFATGHGSGTRRAIPH